MAILHGAEEKKFWADAYKTARPVVMAGAFVAGLATEAAPIAPPAKQAAPKAINFPSAAFSEAQLARLETAMLGTLKPAPEAAPTAKAVFDLATVEDGVQDHLTKLKAVRANLRAGTQPASLAEAQAAQTAARNFYNDVLDHCEKDQPGDSLEMCAALGKIDRAYANLADLLLT